MGQVEIAKLKAVFHRNLVLLCKRMEDETKGGYKPSRLLSMLADGDGVKTAKDLINSEEISEGFATLWCYGRLDLTVEAFVLQSEYSSLFSDEEIDRARHRLFEAQKGVYRGVKVV